MKKITFAVLTVLVLAGCSRQAATTQNTTPTNAPQATATARATTAPSASVTAEYKFKLDGLETPRRDGTVTLAAMGAKTRVTIDLPETTTAGTATRRPGASPSASSSATATASGMPAHIHLGSCPKPGEVKYPLTDVVNGRSVTEVAASIEQMMALGPISVNVHKSATELTKYVACGNLDLKAATASASPRASATTRATASPRASAAQ